MAKRFSLLIFIISMLILPQSVLSDQSPHAVDTGKHPFGFKAGEGPLPLPEGTDAQVMKHNQEGTEEYLKLNYEKALKHFQAALKLKPNTAVVLFNEAVTLDKLGMHKKATLRFQQAKDHAQGNPLIVESPILKAHLK